MPRKKTIGLLVLTLVAMVLLSPRFQALATFPGQLRVLVGDSHQLNLDVPLNLYAKCDREGLLGLNGHALGQNTQRVSLASPLVFEPLEPGQAVIEFRLFGLIPFRRVAVEVLPEISLVPGGQSIGVLLQPDGVLVVGLSPVTDAAGNTFSPARQAGIEVGDVVTRVAGVPVGSDGQIASLVEEEGRAGRTVVVDVRRRGVEMRTVVSPVLCRDTNRFRLGILVRDMTAGVGTLTFYDPGSLVYGALGHVISDGETGQPVQVHTGRIVGAYVSQIQPGRRGEPGEKLGTFIEGRSVLGDIRKNSTFGIYGSLTAPLAQGLYTEPLPMALARQVVVGPAEILTVIEGDQIERFAVEIRRVYSQTRPAAKGLVVQVTDQRLLQRTGGIVQGMSGSPIIQGGRLVGAVTHVFVNDPTRGYGMYAEWMAAEAGLTTGAATSRQFELKVGLRAALAPWHR
jgi:stage IV sporulation protein B